MSDIQNNPIDALTKILTQLGAAQPNRVYYFKKGQRIMNEGDISSDLFLIKAGIVSILKKDNASQSEIEIALRRKGDLIGEGGFLQRNSPRGASIEVISEEVAVIRVTRDEVFSFMSIHPEMKMSILYLAQILAARNKETNLVIQGKIQVDIAFISSLLVDIHNFTMMSDIIPEEMMNAFLFELLETSEYIVTERLGSFEDQGDGFKALFQSDNHSHLAVESAVEIARIFVKLRTEWATRNEHFLEIGIGFGICSDMMSIRKRIQADREKSRILSPTINVAAAMSKYKQAQNEIGIYIDNNTAVSVNRENFKINGPYNIYLERIGRRQEVYRIDKSMYIYLADDKQVRQRLQILNIHRSNLYKLLTQRASFGADSVPLHIMNGIHVIREEIRKLKRGLHLWGVEVDGLLNDDMDDVV